MKGRPAGQVEPLLWESKVPLTQENPSAVEDPAGMRGLTFKK